MSCELCATAKRLGWWGRSGISHCSRCHASWAGLSFAHCTCCHRTFSTNRVADLAHKHDKPLSETTLKRRGLVKKGHKHGELWGYAPSEEAAELWRQRKEAING